VLSLSILLAAEVCLKLIAANNSVRVFLAFRAASRTSELGCTQFDILESTYSSNNSTTTK
jgi:hypothetical protein